MSVSPWSADKAPPRSQWRGEEERTEKRTAGEKRQEILFIFFKEKDKKNSPQHTEGMALATTMALDRKRQARSDTLSVPHVRKKPTSSEGKWLYID